MGIPTSGVYSVDSDGEECGPNVMELLDMLRRQGLPGQIWEHTVGGIRADYDYDDLWCSSNSVGMRLSL